MDYNNKLKPIQSNDDDRYLLSGRKRVNAGNRWFNQMKRAAAEERRQQRLAKKESK